MFAKVLSAVFEFFANKADSVQVGSHGELLVFNLRLSAAGAPLGECLMVEGQSENDVTAYLTRMEFAVKASKLYRVIPVEKAV